MARLLRPALWRISRAADARKQRHDGAQQLGAGAGQLLRPGVAQKKADAHIALQALDLPADISCGTARACWSHRVSPWS